MKFEDLYDDKKTIYSIIDEQGDKSTITIDKWAADLLQEMKPNVHEWIQEKYYRVCVKFPDFSRREKGNMVREVARREAQKSPNYPWLTLDDI